MASLSEEEFTTLRNVTMELQSGNFSNCEVLFNIFDRNHNGTIDASELRVVMERIFDQEVPEGKIKNFITRVDVNKDGFIDINEFIESFK
ncbi:hypothetical protein SteCoe_21175 [Stentor coeruleus]|uniref:EF-hand domain-containing protein n=1 Tax=Stentor coeruleus TaxID=5963 RepID=A0A1R2BQN7_9CILI|nr:hypothetical protein SteCoe_21175 [Stentor coeruleus]